MTPQERLTELLRHGAAMFTVQTMSHLMMATAKWEEDPQALKWCGMFPSHQGHIHRVKYTKVELMNDDRDLVFYNGKDIIATIEPFEVTGLSKDMVHTLMSEWKWMLGRYTNQDKFNQFFDEN